MSRMLKVAYFVSFFHSLENLQPFIFFLTENGDLNVAASEKDRLENKQREFRKPYKNKKESEWWNPRWFLPIKNEFTKEDDWKYVGGYWENRGEHENIPNIF